MGRAARAQAARRQTAPTIRQLIGDLPQILDRAAGQVVGITNLEGLETQADYDTCSGLDAGVTSEP